MKHTLSPLEILFSLFILLFPFVATAQVSTLNNTFPDEYLSAVIDDATSGNNTLIAAVTGKKICVLGAMLVSAGTVTATFQTGAGGTALTGGITLAANSGFTLPQGRACWFKTDAGDLLNLSLSDAISVDGVIVYVLLD